MLHINRPNNSLNANLGQLQASHASPPVADKESPTRKAFIAVDFKLMNSQNGTYCKEDWE
jgi:hypothetical protein